MRWSSTTIGWVFRFRPWIWQYQLLGPMAARGAQYLVLAIGSADSVPRDDQNKEVHMRTFALSPLGILRCTYVVFFEIAESRRDPFKSPIFNAVMSVAFPLYVNLMIIAFALMRLHYLGPWFLSLSKVGVLAIAFGLLALIYGYFGSGGRHNLVVNTYREAGRDARRRIRFIAFSYVVGSIAAFPLVGYLFWWRRG